MKIGKAPACRKGRTPDWSILDPRYAATHRLQSGTPTPICLGVVLSRLFAIFIALSLMFGPLAMDRAMAAVPVASHNQMSADGHCPPAADDFADKAMSKPCCAAMCATAAVVPQSQSIEPMFDRLAASSAPANFHRGVLSEISTPPPRIS